MSSPAPATSPPSNSTSPPPPPPDEGTTNGTSLSPAGTPAPPPPAAAVMPTPVTESNGMSKATVTGLVVGTVFGSLLMLVCVGICAFFYRRRKKKKMRQFGFGEFSGAQSKGMDFPGFFI